MVRSGDTADRQAERTPSHWAALAAALAVSLAPAVARAQAPPAAPPAPPAAPVADENELVLLEADVLIDDQLAHTITAEGDVQVRHQGRTMRADRLVYNLDTGQVQAQGNVEIVNEDGTATYAESVEADEGLNVAVANELRARLEPNGTLAARSAIRRGPGESELRNIIYTSCPLCETSERPPTWSLRARSAIQDRDSRTISYRGAVLEVAGVPVLYLPWFAHPDPSVGRASGLLPPRFGRDSRLGTYYTQPYYWAISPYQDMTLSASVNSHVHPLFGVEYRKRFWSGELILDGTVTYEQDFDSNGDTFGDETVRSSLFAQGRFAINDYWDWGFGAERASDDFYLRRYDIQGEGERRGPFVGDQLRLLSQLYAVGQDARSYSALSFVSFQGLRESDSGDLLPTILPFADMDRVYADPLFDGQLRIQANAAVLQRSDGQDSSRASLSATWRKDAIIGPGIVVAPFAQARADAFRVEDATGEFESFGRGLGYAGAEVSWPFMRPGENFDLIVEPVLMAAYGVNDDGDPRILNEDSLGFELDDSDLFRPNAAPNYDLWEPGGRISAGMRATARAHGGQSASLIVGRRWREEAAPGFTVQNNLDGRASDWVGALQADLGRNFATDVRFRLDDASLEVQRLDVGVRAAWNRFNGSLRYYAIDEVLVPGNPSEEVYGTLGAELARGWRIQAGLRRDLENNINLRQDIRAIYEDDCTFLEIAYTRTETRSGRLGPNEGLQIRIGLRTLGVLGGG
jgi:LPS-assembly protein